MSKAILIIDKLNCCGNCPLIADWYSERYEEWSNKCYITGRNIIETDEVDEKCPLKPIPQQVRIILPRKNGKTLLRGEE